MIGASTESTLKKFAKTESKKKALIRASGSGKLPTKSFIILDNGTFIASPYTVNALIKKVSEMQAADLGDSSLIVRSKVKLRADEIDQIEQNEFEDEFGNINIDDVISKIKESGDFDADEDAEQYAEGEEEFDEEESPEA